VNGYAQIALLICKVFQIAAFLSTSIWLTLASNPLHVMGECLFTWVIGFGCGRLLSRETTDRRIFAPQGTMPNSILVAIEAAAVLAAHIYAAHHGRKLVAFLWTECLRRLALLWKRLRLCLRRWLRRDR
jgi:hypothetical protein